MLIKYAQGGTWMAGGGGVVFPSCPLQVSPARTFVGSKTKQKSEKLFSNLSFFKVTL